MLAIFLFSVYLFSTTEFYQLLKLPNLIEHYMEFSENNPKISVRDFLVIHYHNHLKNHSHNRDYEKDLQLPFVSHSETLGFSVVVPRFESVSETDRFFSKEPKSKIPDDQFIENNFIATIWQPPRLS